MKSESSSSSWTCKRCSKEFKYESEKRRHEQSHEPQFDCKVCSKKFSFLSALRRHEKQHERKGKVPCSQCDRSFRDDLLLKRHMEYAHKGTHICPKCSSTYHSEIALRTHLKTHKPQSERKFRCTFDGCVKTFNFAHHYKHHLLTHTKDRPHICKECGKRFIQLHHLKVHQRTHKPETWLYCPEDYCEKRFTNKYALKRHICTHKNNKLSTKKKPKSTVDNEVLGMQNLKLEESPSRKSCERQKPSIVDTGSTMKYNYVLHGSILTIEPLHNSIVHDPETGEDMFDENIEESTMDHINDFDTKDVLETVETVIDKGHDEEGHDEEGHNYEIFHDENEAIESYENDIPLSNCKSILGQCIVSGGTETNIDCLCAQIDANQNIDEKSDELTEDDIGVTLRNDPNCIEKRRNNKNACETCECASVCGVKRNTQNPQDDSKPEFVYKNNGIIKIKSTFDVDLLSSEVEMNNTKFEFNIDSMSINSCRDVLGNCIVSGNGTIDEGCLCARMTADQQVIAQEIEEITPCPKSHSLSNCDMST